MNRHAMILHEAVLHALYPNERIRVGGILSGGILSGGILSGQVRSGERFRETNLHAMFRPDLNLFGEAHFGSSRYAVGRCGACHVGSNLIPNG
jgi:hypothetical protein